MRRCVPTVFLILLAGCGPIRTPTTASDQEAEAVPPSPAAIADPAAADRSAPARVDFEAQVRPILEACQPCHFEGGKVYEDLPFDRPATIRELGERLFTRIKDAEDQRVIREFLAGGEPDRSAGSIVEPPK